MFLSLFSGFLSAQEQKLEFKDEVYMGRGSYEQGGQRIVDLSQQGLKQIPVGAYRRNIEVLILDKNKLKKLPPDLSNLRSLRVISIRDNELEDVEVLQYLPRLEQIYLSGNHRLRQLPSGLAGLERLGLIDVRYTRINRVPAFIPMMPSLYYFKYTSVQASKK